MALHYVLSDVTIKDMQALGISRYTLRDHTFQARILLRAQLNGSCTFERL